MNLSMTFKGIDMIVKGVRLVKKPYKTEFEERAAKSFISFMKRVLTGVFIEFVCILVCVLSMTHYMDSDYVKRPGVVIGSEVRYTQNEHKFVSLSKLDIEPSSAKEGDKVVLYFNNNDDLIGGKINDGSDEKKSIAALIALIASVIIFISIIIPLTKRVSRDWFEWLDFN